MLNRYMRAWVRLNCLAPDRLSRLSEEDIADMFLMLSPPDIAFDAWIAPFAAKLKADVADQKAAIDGVLSDPVLQGAGVAELKS